MDAHEYEARGMTPSAARAQARRDADNAELDRQERANTPSYATGDYDAVIARLTEYEVDGDRPADGRRVIRDERVAVMAAMSLVRSGARSWDHLAAVIAEANRTLALWRS